MSQNQSAPRPPNYTTSSSVRSSIALGYSTKLNSRGLESLWYGPYTHVFNDMAAPHDGRIVVHPQFTLYIPTLVAMEQQLRQEYQDAGLNWETGEYDVEDDVDSQVLANHLANNDVRRSSSRIATKRQADMEDKKKQRKDKDEYLRKRKAALAEDKKAKEGVAENAMEGIYEGELEADFSITSISTEPEDRAVKEEPDFVLSHIATVELPPPQSDEETLHNIHRAGLKAFHHCSLVLGEVKPPPHRAAVGRSLSRRNDFVEGKLLEAEVDLIEYCAAHFLREPDTERVIVFAAAGLFWRWAVIEKEEVPRYNWLLKEVPEDQARAIAAFHNKFGSVIFILGQPESDAELSKINQYYIHPLVHNGHEGPGPSFNV